MTKYILHITAEEKGMCIPSVASFNQDFDKQSIKWDFVGRL